MGLVVGSDGCNGFGFGIAAATAPTGLSYRIDGDRISFEGAAASTLVGCAENDYEEAFRAILAGTVTYAIDDQSLTVLSDDGRGVRFTLDHAAPRSALESMAATWCGDYAEVLPASWQVAVSESSMITAAEAARLHRAAEPDESEPWSRMPPAAPVARCVLDVGDPPRSRRNPTCITGSATAG